MANSVVISTQNYQNGRSHEYICLMDPSMGISKNNITQILLDSDKYHHDGVRVSNVISSNLLHFQNLISSLTNITVIIFDPIWIK